MIFFDIKGIQSVVISKIENLEYDDAFSIAEVDSICDRHVAEENMTNKERIKIITKSAQFFYK